MRTAELSAVRYSPPSSDLKQILSYTPARACEIDPVAICTKSDALELVVRCGCQMRAMLLLSSPSVYCEIRFLRISR